MGREGWHSSLFVKRTEAWFCVPTTLGALFPGADEGYDLARKPPPSSSGNCTANFNSPPHQPRLFKLLEFITLTLSQFLELSLFSICSSTLWASQIALVMNNLSANAGDARDTGLIPGSGGSPGVRNGNPLQCTCLENPMDRGTWHAIIHEVTKSWT